MADPLYSIWPDAVLSALVPLLGILNANLLVSRPALRTIFHNSSFLKSVANTEDRSHNFKMLTDNSIPLSNVTGELNNNLSVFDCF